MSRAVFPTRCRRDGDVRPFSRDRSILLISGCFLLLSAIGPHRLDGDTRIRLEAHEEVYRKGELVLSRTYLVDNWIAVDRTSHEVIEIQEEEKPPQEVAVASRILRFDQKKMYFLDHKKKTFSSINLPVSLEENLSADEYKFARVFQAVYSPVVEISETAETKRINGASARKVLVHSVSLGTGTNIDAEIWMSLGAELELPLYRQASAYMKVLELRTKPIFDEVYKLAGTPVEQHIITVVKDMKLTQSAILKSAVENQTDGKRYEVPSDYRKVPFDFSRFMGAVESRRKDGGAGEGD